MIIIHHYYPMGSENIGDHLVAHAIHKILQQHFGPAEIVTFPVNDRLRTNDKPIGLLGENLQKTNHEADLVVIGGSNMLEARSRGRWGVFTDAQSIRDLKVPLLLMGMGNGSDFAHRIRRYKEPAITEIQLLHQKAFSSTVRDITTEKYLSKINVESQATGCPVMFLTDKIIQPTNNQSPLIVSFPPPRIEQKISGKAFMQASMRYIEWLQKLGENIVVTLHDTRDLKIAKERVPKGIEIFHTTQIQELINRFENCRGVIGFRLHAALLALGLGKPIIPVGVDWRALGFIRTFKLENISIRSLRPCQFQKLRQLTQCLLNEDANLIQQLNSVKTQGMDKYNKYLSESAATFKVLNKR